MPRGFARLLAVLSLAALAAAGCKTEADVEPEHGASAATPSPAPPKGKMRLLNADAEGDVDVLVRAAQSKAMAEKRRVVVYVGATWCEPCQRFHHAAERGELDAKFPDVDLLMFDADHDAERLASAGYVSKLIPLFALPGPEGRASGKQVEGGIKGDGAVGFIAPRLEKMLAD
ncbi:MAG TPA: thioredoxin family protein [Polyangiaceae bacterium]|jgi:thiol-disulfide isomerase/thioredoxin